ncbi:exodeoxyribonuclease VII large subunit [Arenibaculum pallidiluteum]|uniref:exodeoxyribonuclease VII large subunit n=1 Tax=Arenibaculum pallidiluteum TaxID=2812559 RepID=UPI001F4216A2|nr:exodeoxyribonuclease VII large subunit [Arenibaculum pallidiluteum]
MTQDEAAPPERSPGPRPGSNLPELSVSELSRALKRTVEDAFGYVRVRGEISQPKFHGSGHCYLRLKDESAVLEAVCWKGTVLRLSVRPEEGLEVICTGKLTTYPGRSQYQLVIDSMELAGEGALLKLLEERKRRLAAEGLFDPARKRPLPFLPQVIGVVTSPTGAVIRDILHRLDDRFPRRVLVWPVAVQGDAAAGQIAAAIEGFNRLAPDGRVPRPDLLIVARGGGSLEDLMPFNEEVVVRAAAASGIPLISAVGHETDTTLIDFAADRRAPTPTAAAEMAVPVRAELLAEVMDCARRLYACTTRGIEERRTRVEGLARGLGDPAALLEGCVQRLDDRAERLNLAVGTVLDRRRTRVGELAARIRHPREILGESRSRLDGEGRALAMALRQVLAAERGRLAASAGRLSLVPTRQRLAEGARRSAELADRLKRAHLRGIDVAGQRLERAAGLLESYSFRRVLDRGFALITDADGHPVSAAAETQPGQAVTLEFRDGKAEAVIGGVPAPGPALPPPAGRKPRERAQRPPVPIQESLF